ncbi:MAG: hypothetical protein ACRYG4_09210 [Janthinobacterium lividum]
MIVCPNCGGTWSDTPDDADAILADLRVTCVAGGIVVLPGERVRGDDAARLLDRAPRTLEGWRFAGTGPDWVRGARVTYTLAALAAYVAAERAK